MTSFFFLFQLVDTHRVQAAASDYPSPSATNDAKLTVQLTADVTTATIGSYIHYTMTVANLTAVTTTKTFAFTELPTQTTFITGNVTVQAIAQISGTLQAGNYYDPQYHTIAWVGTLAPQGSSTLFFTVKVKETAACDELLQAKSLWLAEALTIPLRCADRPQLYLSYTGNVTSTTFHGIVQYEVLIRNTGLVAATDLVLRTLLPAPNVTRYLSDTLMISGGNASFLTTSNTLLWTGGVPARGSVRITYAIQVTAVACNMLGSDTLLEGPSPIERLYASTGTIVNCPHINPLQLELRSSTTQTLPGGEVVYQVIMTNTSDLPTDEFYLHNILPIGVAYTTGSATATNGTLAYQPTAKEVIWTGTIPEHSVASLRFQVQVRERIPCGTAMNMVAFVYDLDYMQPSIMSREVPLIAICTITQPWSDFGDAPDSDSNHHGMNNTAYPELGVLGHFPTVWEGTPPNEPSGPTHMTDYFWLGTEVDTEVDADLQLVTGQYQTNYTNILYNGTQDVAGWESGEEDNGWLNLEEIALPNCEDSIVAVRVSRSDLPTEITRLWLNVWVDGNRDGDWKDVSNCPTYVDQQMATSFEWIVQDWAIDATQIPIGGHLDLLVPTRLIYNTDPEKEAWIRFTLSEQQAIQPPSGGLPDGRGVAAPNTFRVGETEDYLFSVSDMGQQDLWLEHWIQLGVTETVKLGEKVQMKINFGLAGITAPVTLTVNTTLPPELTMNTPAAIEQWCCTVAPLTTKFNRGQNPDRTIEWQGRMLPNTMLQITYEGEVNTCPPPDEHSQPILRSVASMYQPNGKVVTMVATYPVDCIYPPHSFLPLVAK